jgi:hypothetical protein
MEFLGFGFLQVANVRQFVKIVRFLRVVVYLHKIYFMQQTQAIPSNPLAKLKDREKTARVLSHQHIS